MDFKITNIMVFLAIISLLLVSSVSAFIVYLRPPKVFVRMNVTSGEYSTEKVTLEVKNLNNNSFDVQLIPQGDFKDHVVFNSEKMVTLNPGEGDNFTFDVRYDQPGTYDEIMTVKYEMEDENPVNMEADIKIIATGSNEPTLEPKDNQQYIIIGFIFLVIIITVSFIFIRRGVKK